MSFETLEIAVEGPIGILSFNRPGVLNAFNNLLMRETGEALRGLTADESVRAIIVRGNGRAFSAGFDLKESATRSLPDTEAWRKQLTTQFDFIMQFWDCPKPTIAAVHGFCLAGAFELALACDLTIAAEGTRFGEPEVRFGSGIVAMLLPWVAGPKRTHELLLTGNDRIDARAAMAMNIVNEVVPAGKELERARQLARTMSAAAAIAVQMTKRAIRRGYDIAGLRAALQAGLDIDVMLNAAQMPEKQEFARIRREQGVKAALDWRDARFKEQ